MNGWRSRRRLSPVKTQHCKKKGTEMWLSQPGDLKRSEASCSILGFLAFLCVGKRRTDVAHGFKTDSEPVKSKEQARLPF